MFHHCPILYIAPMYHIEIHLSPVEHVAKMQTLILGIGFEWDNDNLEDQNIEKQTLQDHWGPLKICLDLFRVVVCCRRAWQVLSHVAATPWDSDGSAVDLWGYIPICAPSDWTWLNCTVNHKTWGCLWCEVYVLYSTEYRLYSCVMMYYRSFFHPQKVFYFVWSPPWHLYILLLANLLAFYLTYLLAFYLAYLLAFYLAYLLAYYLHKSSGILSGKHSGTLSGISSGILFDILSGILSGIPSGNLSGISSNILSGISSGKSYGILSGISSRILSDILSGISSGILSGFWGLAVRTELGRPQVEV